MVEDEHRVATAIKKGLEMERYAVDVAHDGITGYDLASTEDYDLIILDLMLSEMDGLEICKSLRDHKNHVPILMLTAKSQVEDKITGLDSGADDYLTKPFSFEELLARIRALIRRPNQIISDNENLEKYNLSRKEFSLLEYLLRNPNKIISKGQIMAHVWNYDADILPNTVEVYIKKIRKKVKDLKIETVRGFGYRLCLPKQD